MNMIRHIIPKSERMNMIIHIDTQARADEYGQTQIPKPERMNMIRHR